MAGGWASLGLLDELVQSIEEDFRWTLPTAIQDECIPLLLGGGDVMGSAETGSGKTAAFALPVLQLCVEYKEQDDTKSHDPGGAKQKDSHTDPEFLLSKQDRDPSISFDPQGRGLRIQSLDSSRWAGCRCSAGVSGKVPGKYSFECTILDDGIVRIGWTGNADASLQLGTDMEGYGYGGTGMIVNSGNYEAFPSKENKVAFGKGDVVSCHLQVFGDSKGEDEGKDAIVSYSKNGEFLDKAFQILRSKSSKHSQRSFFPTVCVKNGECSLNFGSTKDLQFDLPQGFRPLATVQKGQGKGNSTSKELVANPRDELYVKLQLQKESSKKGPLAIVIEPTRDLAEQTYRAFCDLGKRLCNNPVQAALLVGGISPQATVKLLNQNLVDVLVGTPPIIASYMKKGTIKASRCRFFVLDEADELIDNDSLIHIRSIYGRVLASNSSKSRFDRLQVCFFSATLHAPKVRELADTLCHRPVWVDLRGKNASIFPDTVHHFIVSLSPSKFAVEENDFIESDAVHRDGKLLGKIQLKNLDQAARESELLKQMKPLVLLDLLERFKMEQVLIFCRTNLDCDLMEKFLRNAGGGGLTDKYSCRVLAGMRSMEERQTALQDFKDGEARILVCTDVAARGIDIRELPFVINFTLPDRPEVYVHRIGRVGRAERMGLAISLVSTVKERVWFCRKGRKPPCEDTRDYEKGGNCIWYDEPKLMNDIEKVMKTNSVGVTKLQWPNMNIPPDISVLLETGAYGGDARSSEMNPETKAKMGEIERDVVNVQVTECALQNDYWKLRRLPKR